jgi:predicted nucleic acid-binding protein
VNGYLDSSAIVKLVLVEPGSAVMDGLWARIDVPIASLLGYAEVRSALAAASRAGRLAGPAIAAALRTAEVAWDHVSHVEIDGSLVRAAGELAERHGLRAADAIHLASAIRTREAGTVFVSFDHRLREAAAAEGFAVLPETV